MSFFVLPAALCSWRVPSSQTPKYSNTVIGNRIKIGPAHRSSLVSSPISNKLVNEMIQIVDPNSFATTL
ncbi:hypothetical protein ZWY2020_040383 [Hordeum vulgare]|nr:hypothetical protein ZWY2020_040383 [Hordeum vulgare]